MSTPYRRIASLVLTFCLAAGSGWADSVQVDALRVNVRKEPNTTSPIVTTASRGEVLEVVERAGEWYRIRTRSGAEGYVASHLVRAAAPAGATSAPAPPAATPAGPARAAAPTASPSPWKGEGTTWCGLEAYGWWLAARGSWLAARSAQLVADG